MPSVLSITRLLAAALSISLISSVAQAVIQPNPGNLAKGISTLYHVTAGGQTITVRNEPQGLDVAMLSLDAPAVVQVTVDGVSTVPSYSLKPSRHGFTVSASGNVLTFTMSTPQKLVLQVSDRKPLAILATPIDPNPLSGGSSTVIYFGPGTHVAGQITPNSGQTVYLAMGALVKGRILVQGKSDVTIRGRGVLDVSGYTSKPNPNIGLGVKGILVRDSDNIRVEGISVRQESNSYYNVNWTSLYLTSTNVQIDQYSSISDGVTTDGVDIDGVRNFGLRNSFVRAGDDCFGIHALDAGLYGEPLFSGVTADNVVVWNTGYGNGVRFGSSMEQQMLRNFTIKNFDVLRYHESGLRSDTSDWAWIENVRFTNVTVDAPESGSSSIPIRFEIIKGPYSNPNDQGKVFTFDERGNFEDLSFENVTTAAGTVILNGFDASHKIRGVTFLNSYNGSNKIDSASDISSSVGFVDNLVFTGTIAPPVSDVAGFAEAEYTTSYTGHSGSTAPVTQVAQKVFLYTLLSNAKAKRMIGMATGDFADYRVTVPTAGAYTVKLGVLKTPASNLFSVTINNVVRQSSLDLRAASNTKAEFVIGTIPLNAGTNSIKLTAIGSGGVNNQDLNVDYISYTP